MKSKIEHKPWKVLRSEYISRDPWFTVRREHLQLPNGNEIDGYYVMEYPEWVNVIAITKDNEFVLVSQYRHGIGQTLMELCAGVAEKEDASPMISAQRELLEETGYGKGNWKEYMRISSNASSNNNLVHCFVATEVEKISDEQQLDFSEDLAVHLLTLEEVKQLLLEDGMKQASQVAPLWKYMAENHLI